MTTILAEHMSSLARSALRWFETRTHAAGDVPETRVLAARKRAEGLRVSVVIPALNEAATIGRICRTITDALMGEGGLVDELVVVDGASGDETAAEARRAGADVVGLGEILPEIPPVRGKGEALWRSLAYATGDVVVWVDADIRNFAPHFVTRLVAPLLAAPEIVFVKAFYRRPIEEGGTLHPTGGGRVTELMARPLLAFLFPELGGVLQPLAGEYAGRREVLARLPFFTGYSVEAGLLIDLLELVGLDAMAQADLGERVHRNRPLEELGPMAHAIGRTILRRAEEWGRIKAALDYPTAPLLLPSPDGIVVLRDVELERPPMSLIPSVVDALREAEPAPVAALSV